MKCPKCDVELDVGKAIQSDEPRGLGHSPTTLNSDTLQLVDCWKCPKCGHSENIGVKIVRVTAQSRKLNGKWEYEHWSNL